MFTYFFYRLEGFSMLPRNLPKQYSKAKFAFGLGRSGVVDS